MSFELYRKQRATTDEETVSITKAGVFVLSPTIVEKYLRNLECAQLYFDAATKRIGIKFVPKGEKFSYQIVHPKNSRRVTFSGTGFLKMHKINVDGKGNFKRETFDVKYENGMIVFKIN